MFPDCWLSGRAMEGFGLGLLQGFGFRGMEGFGLVEDRGLSRLCAEICSWKLRV